MTGRRRHAWLRVSAKHAGPLLGTRNARDFVELPVTTERLEIRRFGSADLEPYLHFMTDAASTRYLALDPEQETETGAKALFGRIVASYDAINPVHAYAIAARETSRYVGSCGFAPYAPGVVECYYWISVEHRGNAYAAEALGALLAEIARHVEVRAFCHADNGAAHTVAIRAGMRHVGRRRNAASGLDAEVFSYRASGAPVF